jgi:hypothetical protein
MVLPRVFKLNIVNRFNLPKVAFANLIDNSLYLSSFDPTPIFGKDYEYLVKDAATIMTKNAKISPTKLSGSPC